MLKKIFFIIFSISLLSSSFAQTKVEIDSRLLESFPQEKLDYLKENAPKDLAFMNFMLDNAIDIISANEIEIDINQLQSLVVEDLENINYYNLPISQKPNEISYYRVEASDLILSVNSYYEVKKMFKKEFYKE